MSLSFLRHAVRKRAAATGLTLAAAFGLTMSTHCSAIQVVIDSKTCAVEIGEKIEFEISVKNDAGVPATIRDHLGLYPGWWFTISNSAGHSLPPVVPMHVHGDMDYLSKVRTLQPGETRNFTVTSNLHYDAYENLSEPSAKPTPGLYWSFFSTVFLVPSLDDYTVMFTYKAKVREPDASAEKSGTPEMWSGKVDSNSLTFRIVQDKDTSLAPLDSFRSCKHPVGGKYGPTSP